ncbi:hypothetical protein D3OALGA1CA_5806 [Olavius algarvensis associated proteobacterium Delta 3]|nr:hypothetical protein D3OALGB2SA_1233 [Olavius algarvensis associated proteobacterium Delta 3]CAB5172089.1 hypothetical protein D3OALGA1CA_5806 [Olavius algarvensis associated proteobacterium Delta 3]
MFEAFLFHQGGTAKGIAEVSIDDPSAIMEMVRGPSRGRKKEKCSRCVL